MNSEAADAWVRQTLVRLIEVASPSHHEMAVVDAIEALCASMGFPVSRLTVPGAGDDLLVGWFSSRPELLLTAHVDTVSPTWESSGSARVHDGRIHGLGAIDDKGGVVACLLALAMARDEGVNLEDAQLALGFTVDEEQGGSGSRVMADELQPHRVVVAEGTDLQIGASEAGCVEVWLRTHGVRVHGAMREEGVNAAEAAVRMINDVLALPITGGRHPLHGANVPMLWQIHAGTALNVVPDLAEVQIDFRVVPGSSARAVCEAIAAAAARHGADLEIVEVVEPFETSLESVLVRRLRDASRRVMGAPAQPCGVQAWTDAHNFVERCGSEVVVFGPGHLRHAHGPDESVKIADVVACARILAELIAQTVAGAGDGGNHD